jgi:hypothetical protein
MLIRKEHLPIYMHDLDGSDSLALMVACLRKLQGWNEAAWVEEMSRCVPPSPPYTTTDAALLQILSRSSTAFRTPHLRPTTSLPLSSYPRYRRCVVHSSPLSSYPLSMALDLRPPRC